MFIVLQTVEQCLVSGGLAQTGGLLSSSVSTYTHTSFFHTVTFKSSAATFLQKVVNIQNMYFGD